MEADLVHHVVVERHFHAPFWGIGNEPDGGAFWHGTLSDYLRLYDTVAQAVKSVDPQLAVGGPETQTWTPRWIEQLIQHCASARVPLDFVSWHYYSGNMGEIPEAAARIDSWAHQHGLPSSPKPMVGEWTWANANLPGTGTIPFRASNYFVNDWAAGFYASSLIAMQRDGIGASFFVYPVAEPGGTGYAGSGLMSSDHPWVGLNVYRLWRMLGPTTVPSTLNAPPGVSAVASVDGSRRLTILLARLQYRPGPAIPVNVDLGASQSGARLLSHYVIDANHSDAYDAGPKRGGLETVGDRQRGRSLRVWLRPRSVHLLVIGPASATN
jgi:hypothetical protein